MKALIAEDDPFTLKALAEILRTEGWEVLAAASGTQALSLYEKNVYDLICLDIMMPGVSGFDVCRKIREKGGTEPLLFISAKAEEIDKVLGLELGADDFISKPFGVREVLARIRAVRRRYEKTLPLETPSADFTFGPWDVRPGELRARKGGEAVDLTPREVLILETLVLQRGRAVSRVQLFQSCWGLKSAPASRTLDQHIAVLRKKLEADLKVPALIETVQGVGYRHP